MRCVDLDELMKFPIRLDHCDKEHGDINFVYGIESVLEYAEYLPIIDAVPVIRCRDCKYYQQGHHSDDWLWCMMNHHYTDEEKYCAWAERKEE